MMIRLLALLLLLTTGVVFSQDSEFVFRNDFRPSFEKTISVTDLDLLISNSKALVIDVRLEEDFAKDPSVIPGATYLNPEKLPSWLATIRKDQEVIVYCVAGKWVSQKVAFLLNESGVKVRSLEGGIEAWRQITDH